MDERVGGCQTCPRVNKVRHWNAMAVALRHCPEAKAMAAFGDSRGDARSGCRQVQGYSGSSRAGINLQFAFGSFKAFRPNRGLATARYVW